MTDMNGNPHYNEDLPDYAKSGDGRAVARATLALAYEQRTATIVETLKLWHQYDQDATTDRSKAMPNTEQRLQSELLQRLGLGHKPRQGEGLVLEPTNPRLTWIKQPLDGAQSRERTWRHKTLGPIIGRVVGRAGPWVDVEFTRDHELQPRDEEEPMTYLAGETLTVMDSLLTEVTTND